MLGHYFLCVESKTVDKKSEEDQEIHYNLEISELPDPSKTEKHILTYSYASWIEFRSTTGVYVMAIAIISISVHSVSLYMHMPLLPYAPLCFKLLPLRISFSLTSDPAASTLHSLFSVTIWISLSPCVAILKPKTLHHQSPGLGLLLFPDTSTFSLPFHPIFHYPKSQNTSQILPLILYWYRNRYKNSTFSVYAGCLHMALFAHSSLSTLWGWCHLFTPS